MTNSADKPDYAGKVAALTALRKRAGKLDRIQLDAQLNPGNSGGPVIDDTGDVVGIVQAGVLASGVNFAIPSSLVRSFLSKPELTDINPARSRPNRPIRCITPSKPRPSRLRR